MQAVGVDGGLLYVLVDFLSTINDCCSTVVDVVKGVPQGSVLGPLLFFSVTCDLFAVVEIEMENNANDSTLLADVNSPAAINRSSSD